MIDIHCHLLPAIDDGAKTPELAGEMAQMAIDNGITHSILTPHIQLGRYENRLSTLKEHHKNYQHLLLKKSIPLSNSLGAEVRLDFEILALIEAGEIPFLGSIDGYQILLLELPNKTIPVGIDKLIQWLLDRKIRPIIAHPERNLVLRANYDKVQPFIESGCLLQLTSSAVAGNNGPKYANYCRHLLEKEWVFALASDAHDPTHRPPDIRPGVLAASAIIGERAAHKLVFDNPQQLLD